MDTQQFYDGLTATYHALYPDWSHEVQAQATALTRLLDAPRPGARIADTACGIGTQLVGLAGLGTGCPART